MDKKNEYETPNLLFEKLNEIFDFKIDLAASKENKKCNKFFSEKENGLIQEWQDFNNPFSWCWLNPPGKNLNKWVEKAYRESQTGTKIAMLIPSRTGTKYFHNFMAGKATIIFVEGRLKFEGQEFDAAFDSLLAFYGMLTPDKLIKLKNLELGFMIEKTIDRDKIKNLFRENR